MQLKHYEIVTDEDKLNVDIQKVCMEHTTIKHWAYILHDKDDTRPHYHIYVNFGKCGVRSDLVANWFGVAENFVNKIKGKKSDVLLYLIHGQDDQKNKHQYAPSEVVANFDWQTEVANSKILGDFETYSYAQMIAYIDTLANDEKVTAYNKLKKLWEIYCQNALLKPDRKIEVVFICGKGGVGKTYYAKKMLAEMGLDFCISSASNDPFQDYLGQKAIILDDLRDSSFEMEDLLKMLDNNTNSSVRSRFNNKVFNGEVIVITSAVPLRYWYSYKRHGYGGTDSLEQLYRRIGLYIDVQADVIRLYKQIDGYGNPIGEFVQYRNDVPKLKQEKQNGKDFFSVFDKMCEVALSFEDKNITAQY